MMRKQFFLTLTNVDRNDSSLDFSGLHTKLKELDSKVKVFIVKEFHSCGLRYHFHCLFMLTEGVRKNTYRDKVDRMFPQFSGSNNINCTGCKSKKNVITYMLKSVNPKEYVGFLKGDSIDGFRFYTNIRLNEFGTMCSGEKKYYEKYMIIASMSEFDTLDEWSRSSLSNNRYYISNMNSSTVLWGESRNYWCFSNVLMSWVKVLDASSKEELLSTYVEGSEVAQSYNLMPAHVSFIDHVLYLLLCRSGVRSLPVKFKIPVIVGSPNVGKTRLINKFNECFGSGTFFSCGHRFGDFTGMDNSKSPILVFDDIYIGISDEYNKREKWVMFLIKVLSKELAWSDNKYQKVASINYSGSIVITNIADMFSFHRALSARVYEYRFRTPVDWTGITMSDFKSLLLGRLADKLFYCGSFSTWGDGVIDALTPHAS